MTTITLELPEELAEAAKSAGLLEGEAFARILEDELQKRALKQLLADAKLMQSVKDSPEMTPEDFAEEMATFRAEAMAQEAA